MEKQKLKELLMNLMNGLTDEQKEKAKACKDMNELTALLGEMGAALPDELLDHVAGGWSDPYENDPEYIMLQAEYTAEYNHRLIVAHIDPYDTGRQFEILQQLSDEWLAQGKWGRFQDWVAPPQ